MNIEISIKEIIPPLPGNKRYAAKVAYLSLGDGPGQRRINKEFGEVWGTSADEAEAKLMAIIENWLNSEPDVTAVKKI